jgi:hypothetical protein
MGLQALRNAADLMRVDPPEERATPQRSACADWLEAEILDAGKWPMPVTEISNLSKAHAERDDSDIRGWSRQHITNTLDHYFAPAREDNVDVAEQLQLNIQIPATVDNRDDYLRGFLDGVRENL